MSIHLWECRKTIDTSTVRAEDAWAVDVSFFLISFFYSQPPDHIKHPRSTSAISTITLLVSRSCPGTPKLLRFAPPIVRHQQCPIVSHQRLLQLVFRIFVHIFLIIRHYGFGDSLADGVDLGGVPTTGDTDADVDVGELIKADDEERFVDLRFDM